MTVAANQPLSPSPAEETPFDLVIEPRRGWIGLDVPELVRFRELLFFLVWRDVRVRYKQTVLGVAWAILQPIFNVLLFTWVFGNMANLSTKLPPWIPFSLWVYAALLPWMLISTAVSLGGMSLVNSQNMLTKVYFPRLFVPAAIVGGALVDMIFSLVVFAVMVACHRSAAAHVQWTIVFIPLLMLLTIVVGLGMAYILAALTITYRDFRFLIPFLSTGVMYAGCIMIPSSNFLDPSKSFHWRLHVILSLNPMYGLANAWRAAVFGIDWYPMDLAISSVTAVGLLILGLFYFRKTERRFADIA